MFKQALLAGIALVTFGGATTVIDQPQPVSAAVHYIKWHGKRYRSKYTIKQMRRKYHLKYYKSKDLAHVTWVHNKFLRITKGANIHTGKAGETHVHGSLTHKGTFAEFYTSQVNGGNAYSATYVNLKTGKHYHDQA